MIATADVFHFVFDSDASSKITVANSDNVGLKTARAWVGGSDETFEALCPVFVIGQPAGFGTDYDSLTDLPL